MRNWQIPGILTVDPVGKTGSLQMECSETAKDRSGVTLASVLQSLKKGEVSSLDLIESSIAHIESQDATLGAVVALYDKEATELARVAQKPCERYPLAGVPILVKDNICVDGHNTTCGSKILSQYASPYSASVVERLKGAGAIVLGKTNLDEFAMGGSTETSIFGACRNPWDSLRTAGGSSGGSAAAVSAGYTTVALGSDTGGSIRQPAAFCGVCGLKPTYGRVSRYGLVAYASSLDQIGPMARTVQDLALLASVIFGPDERDSTSLMDSARFSSSISAANLRDLRVGILVEQMNDPALDDGVRDSIAESASVLEKAGAKLTDVSFSLQKAAVAAYYIIAMSEASSNLSRFDGVHYGHRAELERQANAASSQSAKGDALEELYTASRTEGFGPEVQRRILVGTYALSAGYYDAYYLQACRVRRLIQQEYLRAFQDVDVVLGPVAPTQAYPLDGQIHDPMIMYAADQYTVGANLAGLPAVSLPTGLINGLPAAIQLQAAPRRDDLLLAVADSFHREIDYRPQLATTGAE